MKKFALYCGLAAFAGAAFFVGEAAVRIYLYQKTAGVAPASVGRVKALFR